MDKEIELAKPARVVRVLIERAEKELSLTLTLAYEAAQSVIEWRFEGVTQLRFRGDCTDLLNVVVLQCDDIRNQGWEGASYRVRDYEEEFVSFFCMQVTEVNRCGDENSRQGRPKFTKTVVNVHNLV